MKKSNIYILLFIILASGCSTLKSTVTYSALGGAIMGGFLGKSGSPNKASENFNTGVGALVGAAISGGLGYYFHQSANPTKELKEISFREDFPLPLLEDQNFGMDTIRLSPKLIPMGDKNYIPLPHDLSDNVKKSAKRQYYKKYKTEEYKFENNGKNYSIPSFEIIENGVD